MNSYNEAIFILTHMVRPISFLRRETSSRRVNFDCVSNVLR